MKLLPFRVTALAGCAACAALALAGCASPAASGRTTGLVTEHTSTSSPSSATPRARAAASAALMLKAFVPPPGARAVSASPVPASLLSGSSGVSRPSDNDVVTKTSWWLVPGDPQQVLAWEAAHVPSVYQLNGTGTLGTGIWSDEFTLPAVAGLFDERSLGVSVTSAGGGSAGGGEVAIRVDALVDWIPVRPAGDTVPATAGVVTLTQTPGKVGGTAGARTATVTDRAKVARLAAYLNGQQVNLPGAVYGCPAAFGGSLTATFRARVGGPVLAQASATLSGCAFLSYSMPGKAALGIGGPEGGSGLLAEVDRVAGLNWKAAA